VEEIGRKWKLIETNRKQMRRKGSKRSQRKLIEGH